jgi:carboxymethylenebutenolidase
VTLVMTDPTHINTSWTRIPLRAPGEEIDAFLAAPSSPARGSLVMLQEIFGVNEAMRAKACDFASAGFAVIVPDLFWRLKRRVDLGYGEDERKEGFALMQKFDQAAGAADIRDVIAWLRRRNGDKVALVGFCLGGRMAVLAAAGNADVSAVASFYGVRLDLCLDQIRALKAPFQFHVGDRDAHVPAEHVNAVAAIASGLPSADVFIYPNAQHGFYNRQRTEVYNAEAAALSRSRALALLTRAAA